MPYSIRRYFHAKRFVQPNIFHGLSVRSNLNWSCFCLFVHVRPQVSFGVPGSCCLDICKNKKALPLFGSYHLPFHSRPLLWYCENSLITRKCFLTLSIFISKFKKEVIIASQSSQLALFNHQVEEGKRKKPQSTLAFRQLWVILSKCSTFWDKILYTHKPETVIGWYHSFSKLNWSKISNKKGRPSLDPEIKKEIERIHKENLLHSPERIHEVLRNKNITNPPSPNTIRKYLYKNNKPSPTKKQRKAWRTFLENHRFEIWGIDFFTMPSLAFRKVFYVLVIINHGTRKIEHFAVTKHPTLDWVKQQLRNAKPYDHKPKYLLHDNDSVFFSKTFQQFLVASGIKSVKTAYKAPWQNPSYAERVIGTLRQELLNHIIPINERHLEYLLNEYIYSYYNTHRTHQGLNRETPEPSPTYLPTRAEDTKLKSTPILGGLYHTYEKVS